MGQLFSKIYILLALYIVLGIMHERVEVEVSELKNFNFASSNLSLSEFPELKLFISIIHNCVILKKTTKFYH